MENSFLRDCAANLLEKYGENISNINIMLPTRRAVTFFKRELTQLIANRAIWQPNFITIGQIMSQISSIRDGEQIVLLAELYQIYKNYYNESFDHFHYWGSIMLSDFNTLDNYCCDAKLLYSNIHDLKEIEERFDYLSEDQKNMILKFWHSVKQEKSSFSQDQFISLWNNLYPIYSQLKETLTKKGVGYGGMIYRNAAEILEEGGGKEQLDGKEFAVIGFNALSRSELALFKELKNRCNASFYWDNDTYYTADTTHEAGMFIRQNISLFGESCDGGCRTNFENKKHISIIDAPSEVLGCKYVGDKLQELSRKGYKPEQTAIVLTNESMLIPLLYSIPPQIENINVTSGYPLNLSPAFHLIDAILKMQRIAQRSGKLYYKDYLRVASHSYIKTVLSSEEQELLDDLTEKITTQSIIYIDAKNNDYIQSPFCKMLFSIASNYDELCDNLNNILIYIAAKIAELYPADHLEYINKCIEQISILKTTVDNCQIELSMSLFFSLLKKQLAASKITLQGEPLHGIQVMGILESRNLDFENVFILSLSEDNYPSMQNIASIIPSNLREGYGLPTVANHEAMYSYYFYRLLQRAQNIELIYSSYAGESFSGEASRFLHQLLIESPHKSIIKRDSISLKVAAKEHKPLIITKEGRVADELDKFCNGTRHLSASRLYEYVECPLKFYFSSIEGIEIAEDISEELDPLMAGIIIHNIVEKIYNKHSDADFENYINTLIEGDEISNMVDCEIVAILNTTPDQFNGRVMAKKIELCHFIVNILKFDLNSLGEFKVEALEHKINSEVEFGDKKVSFFGIIDRLDTLKSGARRIIDYKSGRSKLECKSLEEIMSVDSEKKNKAIFQVLLYSMFLKNQSKSDFQDVVPSLYFARDIGKKDYLPLLKIGGSIIYRYSDIEEEFKERLGFLLEDLFNNDIAFSATDNKNGCTYCPYSYVCSNS